MANIDLCANCSIPRTIVHRESLAKDYEIQSLQCPLCEPCSKASEGAQFKSTAIEEMKRYETVLF